MRLKVLKNGNIFATTYYNNNFWYILLNVIYHTIVSGMVFLIFCQILFN